MRRAEPEVCAWAAAITDRDFLRWIKPVMALHPYATYIEGAPRAIQYGYSLLEEFLRCRHREHRACPLVDGWHLANIYVDRFEVRRCHGRYVLRLWKHGSTCDYYAPLAPDLATLWGAMVLLDKWPSCYTSVREYFALAQAGTFSWMYHKGSPHSPSSSFWHTSPVCLPGSSSTSTTLVT